METITSRNNRLIVETAKLKDKKYRDEKGLFQFDGFKLLEEAVDAAVELPYIFVTERAKGRVLTVLEDRTALRDAVITVSDSVFEKLSAEKSPEGVICVAKHIDKLHILYKIYNEKVFEHAAEDFGRIFLASAVRDPGNLGTVIRSAAAFGVDTVFLSADCADIYHPRALRASMGAIFKKRIVICGDMPGTVSALKKDYRIYGAALNSDSETLDRLEIGDGARVGFLVGNEGHGLSAEELQACTGTVFIPMAPGTESLNAAMAATVLMWEGWRHARL